MFHYEPKILSCTLKTIYYIIHLSLARKSQSREKSTSPRNAKFQNTPNSTSHLALVNIHTRKSRGSVSLNSIPLHPVDAVTTFISTGPRLTRFVDFRVWKDGTRAMSIRGIKTVARRKKWEGKEGSQDRKYKPASERTLSPKGLPALFTRDSVADGLISCSPNYQYHVFEADVLLKPFVLSSFGCPG